MLEHDIEPVESKRILCPECNGDILHYTQGTRWLFHDEELGVLVVELECRLCENRRELPAKRLGHHTLSRLTVRR